MRYASRGLCPASHPVALPQLILIVLYPPVPLGSQVASGRFGAHADFRTAGTKPSSSAWWPSGTSSAGSSLTSAGRVRGLTQLPDPTGSHGAGRTTRPVPRAWRGRARPLPTPRSARPWATNARRDAAWPAPPPPGGAHWYAVREIGFPDPETFRETYAIASAWLDGVAEEAGVRPERTVLGGFSQGAVMTYALGLGAGRPRPAGLIALSGFMPTVAGFEARSVCFPPARRYRSRLGRCRDLRRVGSRRPRAARGSGCGGRLPRSAAPRPLDRSRAPPRAS